MVLHTTTRRNTIVALVFIWALVCGGLGWATWSAIELERHASIHEAEVAFNRVRNEALANADALVTSAIAVERSRPYQHFLREYWAIQASDPRGLSEINGPVMLPSPIQELAEPGFALLHFLGSLAVGFSSPQVATNDEFTLPASALVAEDRPIHAKPPNWLAALSARHDLSSLLNVLETAQGAELERRLAVGDENAAVSPSDRPGERRERRSRTISDFIQRVQRISEVQRAYFPAERCEPEWVVRWNLQGIEPPNEADPGGAECVLVSGPPMLPVWLDLTMDGHRQLALVRSVSTEHFESCALLGVVLDWPRLRGVLEEEVRHLLPGAKIEPVEIGAPLDADRLRTIPARVACEARPTMSGAGLSTGMTWGLSVTWVATLLALAALSYGTMRQVTMAERRMRFATAVTHELRTPLTSFQLYSDLLADVDANDAETRDKYVQTLRKESKRLAKLVENVFTYSKVGDAKPVLHPSIVRPAEILDTIVAESTAQCSAAGKQLIVDDRCSPGTRIETDPEFVAQVLTNLVENACKYSAEADDARIWLSASPGPAGGVTFEVEDAGDGVAQQDRRAIFEPFRRIEATQRSAPPGMGLGLALSRYWAYCLGGHLVLLRNTHTDGRFSRFALSLPQGP